MLNCLFSKDTDISKHDKHHFYENTILSSKDVIKTSATAQILFEQQNVDELCQ